MYWNNLADFLAMGKHGLYVWGSVGVTVLLMGLEPLLLSRHRKQLITRLKRQFRAEQLERHPSKVSHEVKNESTP